MSRGTDPDGTSAPRPRLELSAGVQRLLADSRPGLAQRMPTRERHAETTVAVLLLAVAVPLALLAPGRGDRSAPVVALFLLLYAITSRIEFDVGSGYGLPTQLVLVPMLYVLPPGWVPLIVVGGFVAGRVPAFLAGTRHPDRAVVSVANAWHAVGPALVFLLAGGGRPAWSDGALLLATIAAQFAGDLLATVAREWLRLREPPRLSLRLVMDCYVADVCLTPVGFAVAVAAVGHPLAAAVITLPLSALLMFFARDRRARMATAVQLSGAYRGTAMLLGDVVEHDDAYTGSHSRDVLELSMGVGRRMGLDEDALRRLEFASLLHDVGKIAIPNEIINKDGPLTPQEREVINTHTIEGEAMLTSVGGLLGEVGHIVRSCHERYDGLGYPDGLVGAAIPVEARIVACCDAFNAMTTDRAYRRALPLADALAELRRNRGTQFDPAVVDELLALHPGCASDQVPFPDEEPALVRA